jgi:hypothetical protein
MAKSTTPVTAVVKVSESSLTKLVNGLVAQANAFVIKSNDDCERAVEIQDRFKEARKTVKEVLGEQVEAAHIAHKIAKDKFNQYDNPLAEGYTILGSKVGDYVRAQQALKDTEDRKLKLEAQQKAIQDAQALQLQQAQNLMEAGKIDEAQELVDQEIEIEPVKIKAAERTVFVPKVDMRSVGHEKWRASVVNFKLLLDAAAAGKVPINVFEPNEKFLNNQAKFFRTTEALGYPGVVVVKE